MPSINGRFYANPIYGAAVEIARAIAEQDGQNFQDDSDAPANLRGLLWNVYRHSAYTHRRRPRAGKLQTNPAASAI